MKASVTSKVSEEFAVGVQILARSSQKSGKPLAARNYPSCMKAVNWLSLDISRCLTQDLGQRGTTGVAIGRFSRGPQPPSARPPLPSSLALLEHF